MTAPTQLELVERAAFDAIATWNTGGNRLVDLARMVACWRPGPADAPVDAADALATLLGYCSRAAVGQLGIALGDDVEAGELRMGWYSAEPKSSRAHAAAAVGALFGAWGVDQGLRAGLRTAVRDAHGPRLWSLFRALLDLAAALRDRRAELTLITRDGARTS